MKAEIAKWDAEDTKTTDVKHQRKATEKKDDNDDDVILAELLGVMNEKFSTEVKEDVSDAMDDNEAPGIKEKVIVDTSDIGEVVMKTIYEMVDEETANASLEDVEEESEKVDEYQIQTDDTSLEVAVKETVNIYDVVEEKKPVRSTSIVDSKDQIDVHSETLCEGKSVEHVDVSDATGEEEPVMLPNSASSKADEDLTKTGYTFSEATIKDESNEPTDSKLQKKTLKPTKDKESAETVSGVHGDEEPVKLPDTVTNESDEEQTKTKTGDTFLDATFKDETAVLNVKEMLKPMAFKMATTDEDQSKTSVNLSGTPLKMDSVDVSLVLQEKKPIQVPTKDIEEEGKKIETHTETIVQELTASESSLGVNDGVTDKVDKKSKQVDMKENQFENTTKKNNGEDGVIQNDDENNNNNDRKKQLVKRDHVRRRATAKETSDREDELHEEDEKGIKMFISLYKILNLICYSLLRSSKTQESYQLIYLDGVSFLVLFLWSVFPERFKSSGR